MTATRQPADWAGQLRAINSQFALREEELARQLATVQADADAMRQQLAAADASGEALQSALELSRAAAAAASESAAEQAAALKAEWQSAQRQSQREAEQHEAALALQLTQTTESLHAQLDTAREQRDRLQQDSLRLERTHADQLASTVRALTALTTDHALVRQTLFDTQDRIERLQQERLDELAAHACRMIELQKTLGERSEEHSTLAAQLQARVALTNVERAVDVENSRNTLLRLDEAHAMLGATRAANQALHETVIQLSGHWSWQLVPRTRRQELLKNSAMSQPVHFPRNAEPTVPNYSAHGLVTEGPSRAAQARFTEDLMPETVINEVAELLALSGQQFVHGAYVALLGRPPDPQGLTTYLRQLHCGVGKEQIVLAIATSPEGRIRGEVKFGGLSEALAAAHRFRPGIARRAVNRVLSSLCGPLLNRFDTIESQVAALSRQLTRLTYQIDLALSHPAAPVVARPAARQGPAPVAETFGMSVEALLDVVHDLKIAKPE